MGLISLRRGPWHRRDPQPKGRDREVTSHVQSALRMLRGAAGMFGGPWSALGRRGVGPGFPASQGSRCLCRWEVTPVSQKGTGVQKAWAAARGPEWPGREFLVALQTVRRRDSHRPAGAHSQVRKFSEILGLLEAVTPTTPITDPSSRPPSRLSAQTPLLGHLLLGQGAHSLCASAATSAVGAFSMGERL